MSSFKKSIAHLQWMQLLFVACSQWQVCCASVNEDVLIWSQFKNDSWMCGDNIGGGVQCTNGSTRMKLSRCYCIYYDEEKNMSQFGNCINTCFNPQFDAYVEIKRLPVRNASQFNQDMCIQKSQWARIDTHKTGRFCGKCQKGYGLSAYSYNILTCIPCKNVGYRNWLKYFAIALLPLTVFYVLVMLFKINFNSSTLDGAIMVVQIFLSPFNLQMLTTWMISGTMAGLSPVTFGFFNLDFFRGLYSPFCLGEHLSSLHLLALDYIPAVYPFLLIFITYLLVKLYDCDFIIIVWAWKPFQYCLKRYTSHFHVHTSLVETFATFILFSNVKLVYISLSLLVTSKAFDATGAPLNTQYLYIDSTIEYFGHEHLPYGLLALSVLLVFVVLPFLLLLLYPCKCFQILLDHSGKNFIVLRVFMDAFQGSYRIKPHDMRYFSVHNLFLRYIVLMITATMQSIAGIGVITITLILSSFMVILFQPKRNSSDNTLDIIAMAILALFFSSNLFLIVTFYLDMFWLSLANAVYPAIITFIVIYLIIVLLWALFGHKFLSIYYRCKSCVRENVASEMEHDGERLVKNKKTSYDQNLIR